MRQMYGQTRLFRMFRGVIMPTNECDIIGIQKGSKSAILTIEVFYPIDDDIQLGHCEIVQEF